MNINEVDAVCDGIVRKEEELSSPNIFIESPSIC